MQHLGKLTHKKPQFVFLKEHEHLPSELKVNVNRSISAQHEQYFIR